MAGKTVKLEQTGNRQVNDLQQAQSSATQQLRDGPFGNGNLVQGIKITAGTLAVNHGLGRAYQGFVVVRYQVTHGTIPDAIVEVSDPSALGITIDPTKQILLGATNTATLDIWFF